MPNSIQFLAAVCEDLPELDWIEKEKLLRNRKLLRHLLHKALSPSERKSGGYVMGVDARD